MKKISVYALAALATFALPSLALASSIVVSVGNTAPTNPFDGGAPLVSGNTYGSAVYTSNFVAPSMRLEVSARCSGVRTFIVSLRSGARVLRILTVRPRVSLPSNRGVRRYGEQYFMLEFTAYPSARDRFWAESASGPPNSAPVLKFR